MIFKNYLYDSLKKHQAQTPFTSSGTRPKANIKTKGNTCAYKTDILAFAPFVL